jgi:antitoxin (DNA-binding transcriptional repressor) of toxin-antitoxin stability system
MTIRFDITGQPALAELVAHVRAGEEVVLTSEGETVAIVNPPSEPAPAASKGRRTLGLWEHLNLNLPEDLFIGPDPETLAEVDNPIFPPEEPFEKN